MVNPNFVCTICSQTFTRRWRGTVHNNNKHEGVAKIVRLIDYLVGRNSGEYLPSDPSLYRRKKGNGNLAGQPAEIGLASPVSLPMQVHKEAKRPLVDKKVNQEFFSQISGISSVSGINQQPQYHISYSRPTSVSIQQHDEVLPKMVEIKRLISDYLPPEVVRSILYDACSFCVMKGDNRPLDITLSVAREKVGLREAMDHLKFP